MTFQVIQDGIANLSSTTGLDEANLKILICSLLSFPFSFIYKRLPDQNYTLKNVYIVSVSAFYMFGIASLYLGFQTLFISAMGSYFITRYLRTLSMPWVNFMFVMGHLAYNHLHEQFFNVYDPSKIDITGAQMVLVMKLSAFGWNVHDGRVPVESLTPYARERVIKKHPNILPFLGYVFFYAAILTGPAFDYADYDKFIHCTLFDVPQEKLPHGGKRKIPRSGKESFKKTLQGFMWAYLFVSTAKMVDSDYLLSGSLAAEHGFVYRMFYLWILGFTYRLKYYAIWSIAEGACILCGIGFNGTDPVTGKFKWNRVQNIDPLTFETGQNVHTCLEAWNMNTNKWLKNYVYLRIAKKNKKPGFKSTLFTFTTSAFWHGTRPGYYLTFVLGALYQTVGKIFRKNLRPIFLEADGKTGKPSKTYYDLVCFFVTQLAFGVVVQPFVILDFKKSLYCWSVVYFCPHIITMITLFLFKGPYAKQITGYLKSLQASEQEKKKKLSANEADTVTSAVTKIIDNSRDDVPTLGVPSLQDLETLDKEEIKEELKELGDAWDTFKKRRGSIKEDDFEGLKDAYNNFTSEITEIFNAKKEEIEKANLGVSEEKPKQQ